MKPITVLSKGSFRKTNSFLERAREKMHIGILNDYGRMGVEALKNGTPRDTGETADSWYFTIDRDKNGATITWHNDNIVDGANVALLIQYGHATTSGTFVEGIDYINPIMKPVFDKIAEEAWEELNK